MNHASLSPFALQVQQTDKDRFLCALFAPKEHRETLLALYAFNQEVAKIRETVSEPMAGMIRLQWWRDAIDEIYEGKPVRGHPVVLALKEIIQKSRPPKALFEELLLAREWDLYSEPPASIEALETYAAHTSSNLMKLALYAVGAATDASLTAASHAGIAYALSGMMRATLPWTRQGRTYIPADLLYTAGIPQDQLGAAEHQAFYQEIGHFLCERAIAHLSQARARRKYIPAHARTIFLPVTIAEHYLERYRRHKYRLFMPLPASGRVIMLLKLWWNSEWKGF